jgi:hypothetical protein
VHFDVIQSFISPTNAQSFCFKILKFTLKYTINAPTCFGLTKPSSASLQSGRVAAYYAVTRPNCLITKYINSHQYCNFSEAQAASSLDDGLVKSKHVGAFIVYFNVNCNILKQIG